MFYLIFLNLSKQSKGGWACHSHKHFRSLEHHCLCVHCRRASMCVLCRGIREWLRMPVSHLGDIILSVGLFKSGMGDLEKLLHSCYFLWSWFEFFSLISRAWLRFGVETLHHCKEKWSAHRHRNILGMLPLPVSQLSDDHIMFMGKKKQKCTEKFTLKGIISTASPDCSFRTAI